MASGKEKADVTEPCKEPAALSSAHKGLTRKGERAGERSQLGQGKILATWIKPLVRCYFAIHCGRSPMRNH